MRRYRLLYLCAAIPIYRSKFYFVWYMAEAGCIATGFGYNGEDAQGNTRWDKLNNIDLLQVEFGTGMTQLTNSWNKGVNNWLKMCM